MRERWLFSQSGIRAKAIRPYQHPGVYQLQSLMPNIWACFRESVADLARGVALEKMILVTMRRIECYVVPLPLSAAVCGEPAALSLMLREADRVPEACGVNFTEIVQLPPAATLIPHVFVWLKSVGSVPVIVMLVIDTFVLPLFDSVIVRAEPVFLTF